MDKNTFRVIVRRYLHGKSSDSEKVFLEAYDAQFDRPELKNSPKDVPLVPLERRFIATVNRIDHLRQQRVRRIRINLITAVAASLLMILGIGLIYREPIRNIVTPETFHEQQVANGRIGRITLPDGTGVTLNAGSRLRYSSRFNERERTVFLDGEAFFDVARNRKKPFVVDTRRLSIRVLGTSFNVNAYADDGISEVAVSSGEVAVHVNGDHRSPVSLSPREGIRLDSAGRQLSSIVVDSSQVRSWEKGVLNYTDLPLAAVTRSLERYYGKVITLDDELSAILVSARIAGSLAEALRALAKVNDARLEDKDGRFHIRSIKK